VEGIWLVSPKVSRDNRRDVKVKWSWNQTIDHKSVFNLYENKLFDAETYILYFRYVAICHPMKAHAMSGLKRVVRVIVAIWCLAAVLSVPQTVQYQVLYAVDNRNKTIAESAYCGIGEDRHMERTFEISTFLLFVFPMTLVTVMYTMIALAIRRSELIRDGSDASHRERLTGVEIRVQQQARARRSVLKMLGKNLYHIDLQHLHVL